MLRTTLGLRDEASSDTVSTEHNYLQPTIRRIDINHRASINTSLHGKMIHVMEHNISPTSKEAELKDSIRIR